MKIQCIFILAAVCVMSAACAGLCADAEIAVVDMGRVMNAYHETKSADLLLEKQLEEFKAERDEMLAEHKELQKEFETARKESENKALSEKARESAKKTAEEKLLELRKRELKIRERLGFRQKQIADQKMRMQKRIVSELRAKIAKYAEKRYLIVIDSSGFGINGIETVVYSRKGIDITEDVLKIINKKEED